jgi:hypothetical protein
MPSITLNMPAYKATASRPVMMESVCAQISPNWCLLIVDEASTDHTGRVTATAEVAKSVLGG